MLSHSTRALYWRVFRRKAHRLLGEGYQNAIGKIREDEWEEDDITGFIVEQIEKRLDVDVLSLTPQYANFKVQEQRPVNQVGRPGKKRQKIDIIIRCPQRPNAISFVFEAKRLRTHGFPIGLYTGDEGMGCFLNDEYAKDMPEAAMIGYFQNEDTLYWEGQLRKKLSVSLEPCSVVKNLPFEYKTVHVRKSGSEIDICHIFLDCCPAV